MNEKYLPIKIFEKRKNYDDRSTEGGGDSHESRWVLHGEELNSRASYLNENVRTVQASFKKCTLVRLPFLKRSLHSSYIFV